MKRLKSILTTAAALFILSACHEKKEKAVIYDTPTKGTIEISADESFEPVIREQISVFESSWPETKINVHFKSEADCLKDFFRDSATRMVIVTRGITKAEEKALTDNLQYPPRWKAIASDAIAIIVNKNSNDTLFSTERLRDQLLGKVNREQTMVFDGLNRTSTVRFIEDSILKGQHFDTSVVKAVENSDEVIKYIGTHENAIGFTGINRIGNPEDPAQREMLKTVKIAYLKCDVCVNTPYVFPSQESIMNKRYPLVRGLFYLLKENYEGLGSAFAAFLRYERGQLIFRRAYLGAVMEFSIRNVKLNEKLPGSK